MMMMMMVMTTTMTTTRTITINNYEDDDDGGSGGDGGYDNDDDYNTNTPFSFKEYAISRLSLKDVTRTTENKNANQITWRRGGSWGELSQLPKN